MKDGRPLGLKPGDVGGRLKMALSFELIITELSAADAGLYICVASNEYGEAHNSTFITVVGI
ncbi:hypothetical protein DPMN_166255 [Dreissena polymorpha]|uniref:Immunoglobulin I-set domain-containing protein n=1 Tax=Dreissena polymorpha TaxID=45954 RepID=A0A9D4EWI4_DREPO|nr:hypothetical protein DPMN_166255 [Dreissena polymorpha]